jgi:uncharacterized protein (DUF2062 family)
VLLLGLAIVSVVIAAIGYVLAIWLWRERMGRKWRSREIHRHPPEEPTQDLGFTGGTP